MQFKQMFVTASCDYTCFAHRTRSRTFFKIDSDEDHQQLHECFQHCRISLCTLLPSRFAVVFNFNLTYGLKPQVGGIKIVIV